MYGFHKSNYNGIMYELFFDKINFSIVFIWVLLCSFICLYKLFGLHESNIVKINFIILLKINNNNYLLFSIDLIYFFNMVDVLINFNFFNNIKN